MHICHLRALPTGIAVHTPYDAAFVAALKAGIPATARKWQPDDKAWIVSPQFGNLVAQLIAKHFGQTVAAPVGAVAKTEMRMLRLEYLGAAKDRGDGTQSAFGWTDGGWNCIFPLATLQSWFCQDAKPGAAPTLYGVLGLAMSATIEEIKKSFRRLAMQNHPDVSKEPDAADQFRAIKDAYDILADSNKRARYNAGLQLAGMHSTKIPRYQVADSTYRPPLRCGWLLVEGCYQVGRFVVSRILRWEDITENGKTMVASWPRGADKFETRWV